MPSDCLEYLKTKKHTLRYDDWDEINNYRKILQDLQEKYKIKTGNKIIGTIIGIFDNYSF